MSAKIFDLAERRDPQHGDGEPPSDGGYRHSGGELTRIIVWSGIAATALFCSGIAFDRFFLPGKTWEPRVPFAVMELGDGAGAFKCQYERKPVP